MLSTLNPQFENLVCLKQTNVITILFRTASCAEEESSQICLGEKNPSLIGTSCRLHSVSCSSFHVQQLHPSTEISWFLKKTSSPIIFRTEHDHSPAVPLWKYYSFLLFSRTVTFTENAGAFKNHDVLMKKANIQTR